MLQGGRYQVEGPVCTKNMELKKDGTGAMTTTKNSVFLGYKMKIVI